MGTIFANPPLEDSLVGEPSKKNVVAFPWVVTSTGPGGFMICVFII